MVPVLIHEASHVVINRNVVTAASLAFVCTELCKKNVLPQHLSRTLESLWASQPGGRKGVDKNAKVHNKTTEGVYPIQGGATILRVPPFADPEPWHLRRRGCPALTNAVGWARRRVSVTQSGCTRRALHGPRERGALGHPASLLAGCRAAEFSEASGGKLGAHCRAGVRGRWRS